jgi:hypothetical protein
MKTIVGNMSAISARNPDTQDSIEPGRRKYFTSLFQYLNSSVGFDGILVFAIRLAFAVNCTYS